MNLYRLKEDAQNPEDGEFLGKKLAYYDYAGFHRESLKGDIKVQPGERIAVVVTETITDKDGVKLYFIIDHIHFFSGFLWYCIVLIYFTFLISPIPEDTLRLILEKRHLCFMTWEAIAYDLGYSVRWVQIRHQKALEVVQKILDEKKPG